MKKQTAVRLVALSSTAGLSALLMALASAAVAQETAPAKPAAPVNAHASAPSATPAPAPTQNEEAMAEETEPVYERVQVGDATQGLLAWQRSGEIASPTPRPIAGNIANRSYERYLKSFEFAIPEHMNSTVKTSGGSGSSSGAPK